MTEVGAGVVLAASSMLPSSVWRGRADLQVGWRFLWPQPSLVTGPVAFNVHLFTHQILVRICHVLGIELLSGSTTVREKGFLFSQMGQVMTLCLCWYVSVAQPSVVHVWLRAWL